MCTCACAFDPEAREETKCKHVQGSWSGCISILKAGSEEHESFRGLTCSQLRAEETSVRLYCARVLDISTLGGYSARVHTHQCTEVLVKHIGRVSKSRPWRWCHSRREVCYRLTGRSRFMLRQLRLEMSLSQCGLAHTYPASETPYHCPGAPLPHPPLLFTDSAKRENDRGIYDTSLQGTLSPLNRINIKQQTSSIRSSVGCCHCRNWTSGTT